MHRIILILSVAVFIYGCNSSGSEKKVTVNTADTNLTVTPATSIATDTDDHNRGMVSEVALDSPVGPQDPTDTIGRNQ